jgi:hypothetical protein
VGIAIVLGFPRVGWACAVCSAGLEDENRLAFLLTTIFLSALPISLVGGVVWWLRVRVRQMEAAKPPLSERSEGEAASAPAVSYTTGFTPRITKFPAWRSSQSRWLAWPRRLLRNSGRQV